MEHNTPAETAFARSGMTYREVGERIGMTPQGVCEIIKGRSRNPATQFAIATVLAQEVAEMFPGHPLAKREATAA